MSRAIRGVMVLVGTTMVLIGAGVPAANASDTLPLECLANGTVQVQPNPDGTARWTVDGSGTCQGDFTGPATMTLHGVGSSIGISQCSGSPITQDFKMAVQVELSNSNGSKMYEQAWTLPVDNYSVRTAFLIGGGATGAGYIGHNIFLACPGHGDDAATFALSFLG